jgi:hypothetical protein
MTKPKYSIGPLGNLRYPSRTQQFPSRKIEGATAQANATARRNGQNSAAPVLRLRPNDVEKCTEQQSQGEFTDTAPEVPDTSDSVGADNPSIHQPRTFPDGPWTRHPDEIKEDFNISGKGMQDDISIKESRVRYKEHMKKLMSQPKATRIKEILYIMTNPQAIDMTTTDGLDEELVDLKVEKWYVNAPIYLQPGANVPPSMRDCYHHDWSWNARGVYYRQYYSPEWVTGDHSLWVPTLDHVDWDDRSEEPRRMRAKTFLRHALGNGQWRKSEYAWEADAWNDVFGQMRDDPTIAA